MAWNQNRKIHRSLTNLLRVLICFNVLAPSLGFPFLQLETPFDTLSFPGCVFCGPCEHMGKDPPDNNVGISVGVRGMGMGEAGSARQLHRWQSAACNTLPQALHLCRLHHLCQIATVGACHSAEDTEDGLSAHTFDLKADKSCAITRMNSKRSVLSRLFCVVEIDFFILLDMLTEISGYLPHTAPWI